jgi:tRNA dimethylallyltransferase
MHTVGAVRDTHVRASAIRSQRVVGRGAPGDVTELAYSVVAIFGPTASGKSAVAQELAARTGTEVVSADALQVYTGIPILTNQCSGATTRLTAFRELSDEMSVGEYATLAHGEIDGLVGAHGCAVVTGGTGLYLRAALADLAIPGAVEPAARATLERLYDADPTAAYDRLTELDPAAAAVVHPNDRRRVVRALELADSGDSLVPESAALWSTSMRHPTLVVGLDLPADALARRIRARAEAMIARGAVAEAQAAMAGPISKTAAKALGLAELTTLPLGDATDRLVERTRRYARYQRKWMRRIPEIALLDANRPPEEVVDDVLDLARAR